MIESLMWGAVLRKILQDTVGSRLQLSSARDISTKPLPITGVVLSPQLLLAHIQLKEFVHLASLVCTECRLPVFKEVEVSGFAKMPTFFSQCLCRSFDDT